MRLATLLTLLACTGPQSLAQSAPSPSRADFAARVLAYVPETRPGVSDEHVAKGRMILRETSTRTGGQTESFNMADFFNAFIAFGYLQEEAHARDAYALFREYPESCEYVTAILASRVGDGRYSALGPAIERDVQACASGRLLSADEGPAQPQTLNLGSDPALHLLLARIEADDQRYRSEPLLPDWAERQRPLDEQNLRRIDSLFAVHGTYLGQSLVGDQATTMWAVIQHSNPEAMQRYAPVLHRAVRESELPIGPYRMLVDRIYSLTEGYQIFGSQGAPLGTEAQIEAAKRRYGIDE